MPSFSTISESRLQTCDGRLQRVMREAIKIADFSIICGRRTPEEQHKAFIDGYSQKDSGQGGKHESYPSLAVDIAPWPVDWKDRERFILFAGMILGVAYELGITLRWGGDWDRDWQVKDEYWRDLGHFEVVED